MDQHTHPSIRDSDVREIRETVEKITTRARPERVNTGIWRLFANAEKFAFRQTLLGYSVSIILLALVPMFPGAPLLGTALSIAILATLLGIAFLVLIPVNGLPLLQHAAQDTLCTAAVAHRRCHDAGFAFGQPPNGVRQVCDGVRARPVSPRTFGVRETWLPARWPDREGWLVPSVGCIRGYCDHHVAQRKCLD
jgi:hypothetical protein